MSEKTLEIIHDFGHLSIGTLVNKYSSQKELLLLTGFTPNRKAYYTGMPRSCDVAFSGGPDSTFLAVMLAIKYVRSGFIDLHKVLTLHHMVHGIRPENDDLRIVKQTAELLECDLKIYYPKSDLTTGGNVEERARNERKQAFPKSIITGHNQDDNVETFFMNILRGSGLEGISGMMGDNKPLLTLRSKDIRKAIEQLGIEVVNDYTNDSSEYRRNRVRNELIPLMNDIYNKDINKNILSLMNIADKTAVEMNLIAVEEYVSCYNGYVKKRKISDPREIMYWSTFEDSWYQRPLNSIVLRNLKIEQRRSVIRQYFKFSLGIIPSQNQIDMIILFLSNKNNIESELVVKNILMYIDNDKLTFSVQRKEANGSV